jgi:hypothetical protein
MKGIRVRDGLTSQGRDRFEEQPGAVAQRPAMAFVVCVVAALVGMAVCAAAILVPAPVGAVPFVVMICAACPLLAGWEAASVTASRRADRAGRRALARLRSTLDRLPETEHPLGL